MAIVILGGLLSATALNMVVLPALYCCSAKAWRRRTRRTPKSDLFLLEHFDRSRQ